MGERIRAFDWARTSLGPPEDWSKALKTTVRIMLASRQPIWIGWGPELIYLYNDPYKAIIGGRHPSALGQPSHEVWPEIWDVIGPMLETAMGGIQGTYVEEQLLIMERHGFAEETYYTYSYTPVPDDDGQTGGIICANTDDTLRVIGQRQLGTLRELSTATANLGTWQEVCTKSASALSRSDRDLPFALLYIVDESGTSASLAASHGLASNHPAAPQTINLATEHMWPLAQALSSTLPILVPNINQRYKNLPSGPWPRPPLNAAAVPIAGSGEHGRGGVLIVGLNPFRQFNADYQSFLSLASAQIGASITVARAYEEERKRAEALAEIDRAKTAFFSNVSHEFRTPLTLMLGPLEELLKQSPASSERDQLQTVHRNGLRLLKLVNTLLDFSRIEAGRVQVSYEQVDLSALTRDLASAFRSLVEKAGLQFSVKCEPMPEPAFVDKDMWEKIIFNLLSNAYKFTFDGGINVKLKSAHGKAILIVSDSGAGIPAAELSNIFKRFHRVQNVRARTYEGTGIGLALVYELVKLHGGDITVRSQPAEGSSFEVTIPLGKAHLPSDHIGPSLSKARTALTAEWFIDEALHWSSPSSPRNRIEASTPTTSKEGRPRIIIADDNTDMRNYVARLLQDRYNVETVADGSAALAAARRSRPAALVSDVMMPVMDGFELLHAIREDPSLKTIPVILLSARAGDEARVEGLEHHADDYLVKPFSGRELIARLETHLKLLHSREEMYHTEQRLRDETRAVSERLDSILSSMDDLFHIIDHDWRFLYVNERLLQATKRTRQELIGARIWDAFPEVASGPFYEQLLASARERKATRFEYFYRTGGRWYDNRVYPAPEGLAILATDVTDRKKAEEKAATLAAAVESSDDAIITKTLDGIITSWNNGAQRLFGYAAHEAIGQPITMLIPGDRQHEEASILKKLHSGGRIEHFETVRRRKDGTLVDISLTISPILNDRGEIIGASKIARDVTELRKARTLLERSHQELERRVADRTMSLTQAVAQMEEFSYSVSHDLRAPVRAMQGYAQVLLQDYGERLDDTGREYLDHIVRSGARMDRLVRDILTYSRLARAELTFQPVSLDALIRDIIRHYPEMHPPQATITLQPELGFVIAHEPSLTQAISNLLSNAVKFVPAGVTPLVEVSSERRNSHLRLSIQDNGIGIKPEHQGRLFGLFQRIHPAERYEGTGIGLAVVRKSVERMGGKVGVESNGVGSKFWIELPVPTPQ